METALFPACMLPRNPDFYNHDCWGCPSVCTSTDLAAHSFKVGSAETQPIAEHFVNSIL